MEVDVNFKNQNKHWILVILFLGILIIIIAAGIWGYDYYKNIYLPEKLLNEAVSDIKNKLETYEGQEKALYAYNILQPNYNFGYDNLQDSEIRNEITALYEPAFKFIENQAFYGNARCQFLLASLYFWDNNYVEHDNEKYAYWLNESANNGYIEAYNNLGICYKDGIGVSKNIQMAIHWLKMGAGAGEKYAQKNYGDLFLEGVKIKVGSHKETRKTSNYKGSRDNVVKEYSDISGREWKWITIYQVYVDDYEQLIPKDIEQAKYWWKKAAAQGHQPAIDALQKIY